jgi:enolase-phosphatase E1
LTGQIARSFMLGAFSRQRQTMTDIRAIVTDIEGTTSSISFVRDVLFPYARERLPAFIETHGDTPEVQHWLHEAAKEAGLVEASRQEIIERLIRWIDEDRKSTALKALQGMIWKDGYEAGDYQSHMSGSVPAQKLLFGFSEAGDLTPLFSGYFDTETGHKREADSYTKIAEAISLPPHEILFLSDIVEELDAAQAAGLQTAWLIREPLAWPNAPRHAAYRDFDAIQP